MFFVKLSRNFERCQYFNFETDFQLKAILNEFSNKLQVLRREVIEETDSQKDEKSIEIEKERYISPEKRQCIIDQLKLI